MTQKREAGKRRKARDEKAEVRVYCNDSAHTDSDSHIPVHVNKALPP